MGYWVNHKYERRSVQRDSIQGFIGFDKLKKLLQKFGGTKRVRNQALAITTFKTGGRITETLNLKGSNFEFKDARVICTNMIRLKNKKRRVRRQFRFSNIEPMSDFFRKYVEYYKDGYLFKSPSKDKPLSYIRAYQIMDKIGIYPHWLRDQRALCLVQFYHLGAYELKEWFDWESVEMALHYAGFGIQTEGEEKILSKTF